ncbi:MAG TPA: phospholipase D-like domain-containing protein, partial [Candidatus Sulfotelmatobacter sp.]|nr:phospholipase D-like domain-containing protein [Candidatus Sulfotelmatobacter sp.]
MVIVDGRIAFTGGANIMAVYGSSSRWAEAHLHHVPDANTGWRDTDIEIRGPAVADFQRLFLETWRRQHGSPLAPRCYFPALHREGDKTVAVIGSGPGNGQSRVYFALLSAIANAADSIHITMAYFVPDRQLLQELIAAARRGVEVTLILPGITDHASILAAARAHYAELLAAGVRIYEERDFLLHAKTAVIDGVWSTVGSANMDFLSFLRNDELNAVVLGGQFGRQMEAMFQADLRVATRVNPATWAERSVWERLMESCATAVEAWL